MLNVLSLEYHIWSTQVENAQETHNAISSFLHISGDDLFDHRNSGKEYNMITVDISRD